MSVFQRAQKIVEIASSMCSQMDHVSLHTDGYAEPGYTDPKSGVIALGNWNDQTDDDTPGRVAKLLEKLGVELEWEDEWTTCCDCRKLVRTSPNGYGWSAAYWSHADGAVCEECVLKDPSDYLASLEGKYRKCMTINLDLEEHGYVLIEGEFENGFHTGQNADPKVIAKSLRKLGVERFIFKMDDVSQFSVTFSLYVHKDEAEKIDTIEWEVAAKDGPDLAAGLARALQAAAQTPIPDAVVSQGRAVRPIAIHQCDASTGEAKTCLLTPEEFIDGSKSRLS